MRVEKTRRNMTGLKKAIKLKASLEVLPDTVLIYRTTVVVVYGHSLKRSCPGLFET